MKELARVAAKVSIVLALVMVVPAAALAGGPVELSSSHLVLRCDVEAGRLTLLTREGKTLLSNATAAVALSSGDVRLSDARYTRAHGKDESSEPLLPGKQFVLHCEDRQ